MLGIVVVVVVVVVEDPLVVLVDCAMASPVDRAKIGNAKRSRFIVVSPCDAVPSISKIGKHANGSGKARWLVKAGEAAVNVASPYFRAYFL
ncbi:hypothetical protein EN812_31690 [Mesorhizobium sp. M4B.F.Ca.ET.169.01.1.1]|uniref:hypothetical protein n=1 Tax=Mesorhizobium sp. M4B.F.Ca.ET.169.01.1.1 TaxID=2563949 RepID=UPI00109384FA|nr:hypothetical protein [Mesorhizobium sp. M4B.F.Ca.ET.169.01.1.1]TGT36772.1 hypothetical protein EN812_31690 [Mesorhizobium sp. M4B.F.Ca.ET.169.01.1.1]